MKTRFLTSLLQECTPILSYLFFGLLTTAVNFIVFFAATRLFACNTYLAETIAWVLSVLFAYVVNRRFVFASRSKAIVRECVLFIASRIFSYFTEIGILYISIAWLQQSDVIGKLLSTFFVVILNYVTSKWLVFKEKKKG